MVRTWRWSGLMRRVIPVLFNHKRNWMKPSDSMRYFIRHIFLLFSVLDRIPTFFAASGYGSQLKKQCFKAGLWIRIDLILIQIQHFFSIRIRFRIRIQAKTELSKTISFSNFFQIKIWVKSSKKYRCYSSKFYSKISAILYLFSGKIFFLK
jgi:hypothetical protein